MYPPKVQEIMGRCRGTWPPAIQAREEKLLYDKCCSELSLILYDLSWFGMQFKELYLYENLRDCQHRLGIAWVNYKRACFVARQKPIGSELNRFIKGV